MHSRDFTVAVFVVRYRAVLLHWHERLQRWLPPGGHIEPNEIPDVAAVREVFEETGVRIQLLGPSLNPAEGAGQPVQLIRPIGVQLADIGSEGHQHIDLVYHAIGVDEGDGRGRWLTRADLDTLDLTEEVRNWCQYVLSVDAN